ncbi:MAG: leucine-rich repeat protein [Anaerostipes sp.]|nr:leucine-rich repeat protein [Anaerostipes sp.]
MSKGKNSNFFMILIGCIIILCVSAVVFNVQLKKDHDDLFQNDDGIEEGMGKLRLSKDKKYKYRENLKDHTIKLIYCESNEEKIKIPRFIDGYKVTAIGEASFSYMEKVKMIILPNTIENIEMYAFSDTPKLKYIKFLNDVTTIDSKAFDGYKGDIIADKNWNVYQKFH